MVKVIYNKQRKNLREIIRTLCKYNGVEIINGYITAYCVHLLLSILPRNKCVSSFGIFKEAKEE